VIAAIDLLGVAAVIVALGGLVTSVGVIVLAFIARDSKRELQEHGVVLKQVERQGNSVSLELKRTNFVYAERLAIETEGKPEGKANRAIADDARQVYEAARAAAERDGKGPAI